MARVGIPKTTRPALGNVSRRERLFRRLDALGRAHRVVWLSAAAGSGKTTLAASYLAVRGHPCLWYQIDGRDADPATFFYYLRDAVGRLGRRRRETLPLLTADHAQGAEAFAAFFFEALAPRLPRGTWLVLDSYQDCPEDAPLQRMLATGLSMLPDGVHALVMSRTEPPAAFARLLANRAIALVPGEELSLTPAEVQALARATAGRTIGTREAEALAGRAGGWAAGVVLFLQASGTAGSAAVPAAATQRVLFDYFAREIFEGAPPEAQQLLVATAFLPEIEVPAAEALAREPRAGEILADLVRRNLFTLRLAEGRPRYRYHALFREFLQAMARRTLDVPARRELVSRTAEVLVEAGRADEAAVLLAGEGRAGPLAALVRAHAQAFAHQGRLASVEAWLRCLPDGMVAGDPWLSYWMGECRFAVCDEARAHFARAYQEFRRRGEVPGILVSWAGYVGTYLHVWDEFGSLDGWIEEMEDLCRSEPAFPSADVEARVTLGMLAALLWRHGAHPRLPHWLGRASALLEGGASPLLRMRLGVYLAFHASAWRGDLGAAGGLLERVRPLATAPDVEPIAAVLFRVMEAHHLARTGDPSGCLAAVERGLEIARRSGIVRLGHLMATQGVWGALAAGDLATARTQHDLACRKLGDAHMNGSHVHQLGAWIALCAGNLPGAERHVREAFERARASGADIAMPWTEAVSAHVLVERGEHDQALAALARCSEWSRRVGDRAVLHHALLSEAYAHLARGQAADALAPLRRGLQLGREQGYLVHPWIGWRRDVMSRLAALALEHGIEVQHVRATIAASRLAPPDGPAPEAWPWPVRVRMLGGFELWRGDRAVPLEGMASRRPLELLRTLVALGGAGVRQEALADALWPDAEGGTADHALEMLLHRLRKLLGVPGAIVHHERRLGIDDRLCWVDALELVRRMARAREVLRSTSTGPEELARSLAAVVALYRGPLAATTEKGLDLASSMRERLRGQLVALGRAASDRLAAAGRTEVAARFLEQVGSADPALVGAGLGVDA